MSDLIVFGDITTAVVDVIRPHVSPTPCYTAVPSTRPDAFVVVRRLGGVQQTPVSDNPTVWVEAWAGSQEAAHGLLQTARAAIHAATSWRSGVGQPFYNVAEIAGPAFQPDTESNTARYTMTIAVHWRATSGA